MTSVSLDHGGTCTGRCEFNKHVRGFQSRQKYFDADPPTSVTTIKVVSKHGPDAQWQAIKDAWDEDLTDSKIEMAYRLLEEVKILVAANNGGNAYKLPHNGLRDEMRADGWPYDR